MIAMMLCNLPFIRTKETLLFKNYQIITRSIATLRSSSILSSQIQGTYLIRPQKVTMSTRFMLSTRHLIKTARGVHNVFNTISKDNVINSIVDNTAVVLGSELGDLCLDDQKGVLQQKTSLIKHMIPHKFPLTAFYSNLLPQYNNIYIGATPRIGPDLMADSRCLNEVKVVEQLASRYGNHYPWIIITGDSAPSSFTNQIPQSNPDVWAAIRCTPHSTGQHNYLGYDEKSGMNMFKHSTKGTLGYITYDSQGIHSFLKGPINVKEFNQTRLTNIMQALESDRLLEFYEIALKEFSHKFRQADANDIPKLCMLQEKMQDFLIYNVQTNPSFQRNISLVFTQNVEYEDSPQIKEFSNRLAFYLKKFELSNDLYRDDRYYDLNVVGHKKIFYKSMLNAYEDVTDSLIKEKITCLSVKHKISFDADFFKLFSEL